MGVAFHAAGVGGALHVRAPPKTVEAAAGHRVHAADGHGPISEGTTLAHARARATSCRGRPGPAEPEWDAFAIGAFQLKLVTASVAHPIPCIQTFCTPAATGSKSESETIILAVKDSTFPSPWR